MRSLRVAAVGAALILVLVGCRRQQQRARSGPTAVPITLSPVKVEPVQRYVEIVGTLFGDEDATIASKVSGKIAAVYKDVGDRVASDEPLAQIAPIDYELARRQKQLAAREPLAKLGLRELPAPDFDTTTLPAVRRAKLQSDNAEAKFKRGQQLHDQVPPLLSDQDFADLKTAWEVARTGYEVELLIAQSLLAQARSLLADLEMAEQRLADSTVRAPATQPADGSRRRSFVVTARQVSVGEFVREAAPMFRLVDDDVLKLRANIPERHIREIRIGQEVRLTVEAYPDEFTGRVARINPQVDPANRTFPIEVLVPNADHRLKPGSFVRGRVLTRLDPRAIFVPQESIVSFVGVNKVFTVQGGKAVERVIELGERRGEFVEALQGKSTPPDRLLSGDEQVVIEGASKLAEGIAVRLRNSATQPAARAPMVTVSE